MAARAQKLVISTTCLELSVLLVESGGTGIQRVDLAGQAT